MNEVHDRIRLRLTATGKSMREASLDSRLSPEALSKLLNKPHQSQTLETIRKLATGLDTRPEWLAFGIGRESKTPSNDVNGLQISAHLSAYYNNDVARDNDRIVVQIGDLRKALFRVLQLHGLGEEEEAASLVTLLEALESQQEAFALIHLKVLRRTFAESPTIGSDVKL